MCMFLQPANISVVLEISQGCLRFIALAKGEFSLVGINGTFPIESSDVRVLAVPPSSFV